MSLKGVLETGKLPPRLLARMLSGLRQRDPSVILGPALGEDAAVIAPGRRYLISKTDPITFNAASAADLLLQVNANDIATRGGRPRYLQVAALFPPGTRGAAVARLFKELAAGARRMGVTITGGHTEVTDAVTRTVLVGHMLGVAGSGRLLSCAGAKRGDVLMIVGHAGVEGTILLAHSHAELISSRLGVRVLRQARRLAISPGTSVLRAASIAARCGAHAMHDPTEGGVAAAIHEMAWAAAKRISIDLDRIPVLEVTRRICELMGIDPLGLIGSGALLVAIPAQGAAALARRALNAVAIGRFESGRGVRAHSAGRRARLPWFERDELLRCPAP